MQHVFFGIPARQGPCFLPDRTGNKGPKPFASGRRSDVFESSRSGRLRKGKPRPPDRSKTVHRICNRGQSLIACTIFDWPALAKPVSSLFNCRDFLFIARLGDRECKGRTPVNFYHLYDMGIRSSLFKTGGYCPVFSFPDPIASFLSSHGRPAVLRKACIRLRNCSFSGSAFDFCFAEPPHVVGGILEKEYHDGQWHREMV